MTVETENRREIVKEVEKCKKEQISEIVKRKEVVKANKKCTNEKTIERDTRWTTEGN